MPITEYREAYKPFEYDWADQATQAAIESKWNPNSINMQSDLQDFYRITEDECKLIEGLLKGFVITETRIGSYWNSLAITYPKHEIVETCREYAAQEVKHQRGYSRLADSLDINNYEAFLIDPVVNKRLEHFVEGSDPLVSIAVFSGFGEGVSLYSSFAILKSFCRGSHSGQFNGLGQIISYSVIEENSHSEFGIRLFNEHKKELGGLTEEQEHQILEAFDIGLINEYDFLDSIFQELIIPTIKVGELKEYIAKRANNRLQLMGFEPRYTEGFETISEWFDPLVNGINSHDFFSNYSEATNYSSVSAVDWSNVDYSQVKYLLEVA